MSSARILRHTLFALGVPAGIAGVLGSAETQERIPISGVYSMKYSQQHTSPVADAAGPVLILNEAKGTNRNTGKSDYMADSEVIIREIADLTQGNGPHQGYSIQATGRDTTVSRWQGKVVTKLGSDQKPSTSFGGTWATVSGGGRYKGATGSGTYRGRMLSPTEFTVEWSGELVLKPTASR
jgi:hypothetical protein